MGSPGNIFSNFGGIGATGNALGSTGGGGGLWGSLSPFQKFGVGMMGGAAGGSLLGSLFGQNPAKEAGKYLNQIPAELHKYLDPYNKAGLQSMGLLQGQYGQLMSDPASILNKFGAGYEQSPGYQYQMNQAIDAANRAAAAGGMLGSPEEQQFVSQTAQGLANQDYYNYLNKVLGLYGQGLSGEQGIMGQGYGAATNLAEDLSNVLQSQANLAYSNAASGGDLISSLSSIAGMAAPFFI